jgi:tRNA-specific 2-thiouridylase
MYVTGIDGAGNAIRVGEESDLFHRGLRARNLNLVSRPELPDGMLVNAKIRYKDLASAARVFSEGEGEFRVVFEEPKRAITPGQSVVLYEDDDIVGGGIIESALD